MKLITEHYDELNYIVEGKGLEKTFQIEGVFMQADTLNRNKRVYPKPILNAAVTKYVNEQVSTGRAVGELNHPEGPTINLDKVSHRITDLHFEGKDVIGKAKILNTPMGEIVKGLLEGGVKLGVSSRGMGSIKRNGDSSIVNDDFMLSTVDIVQDPSAPSAFVNGIMEGVEFKIADDGEFISVVEEMKSCHRNSIKSDERVQKQLQIFNSFLRGL